VLVVARCDICEVWTNAAGATVETIDYGYDNDGNLTSIDDNSGDTLYGYGMNPLFRTV